MLLLCLSAALPVFTVLAALIADQVLGEPSRYHPLMGFGHIAESVEEFFLSRSVGSKKWTKRTLGFIAWILVCLPIVICVIVFMAYLPTPVHWLVSVILLYFCVAMKSLAEHAHAVVEPLKVADLKSARIALSRIVSRDCQDLDEARIATATTESVLENGSDAVIAPLFWFVVFGAPGVVLYRFANTLDAMWGYKSERYIDFGFAAARIDDLFNLIPARVCALLYGLSGNTAAAFRCWMQQSASWSSPNAGPVMASGAGALGVLIGGPASYQNREEMRPLLGTGEYSASDDVENAVRLVKRATAGFVLLLIIGEICLCLSRMVAMS